MRTTKTTTPFDGRKNDWRAFAKQQAQFYRYADRYMDNLKDELRDLKRKINVILAKTEDEDCNMNEGYRIYQNLKNLRLQYREKFEELQCVQVLTDYFDCDDMLFNCEENLSEIEEILGGEDGETGSGRIMLFGRRAG